MNFLANVIHISKNIIPMNTNLYIYIQITIGKSKKLNLDTMILSGFFLLKNLLIALFYILFIPNWRRIAL